ncbi:EAL domain-containing protein [Butyrivibrio sp. MC2021]|uniref:EAL domain-containing protein n=1 Tax=Butyrivibrio sp. MC2021 TaxID=1408306 RepID=UPI0009DFBB7A|nr:EAL domain-containing protein [Butyrivibrio sp. MC2021]
MELLLRPQHYNITFNLAALMLIAVIMSIHLSEEAQYSKQKHIFGAMVVDAFVVNLLGLASQIYLAIDAWRDFITPEGIKYILIAEKVFIYLLPYFAMRYVMSLFQLELDNIPKIAIIAIPTVYAVVFCFSGFWTDFFYFISDEGKVVYRYPQGATVNIGVILYFIFATYLLIKYTKTLSSEKAIALWLFYFLMMAGIPIRIMSKSGSVFEFSISIALLLCVYTFQNPSEFVDRMSGAGTRNALNFYISTSLIQKKEFTILGIHVDKLAVILGVEPMEAASDLLNQISSYLKELCPDGNLFYPGEADFMMVFPDMTPDESVIEKTVEQIRKRFKEPWKIRGDEIKLLQSPYTIGFPEEVDSMDRYSEVMSVLSKAILRQNRDILRVSDLSLKMVEHDKKIDNIVKHALDDGHMEVYYQPIYTPATGRFSSCEALLRLKDPQLGFISPAVFMPIAERNGTILAIDKYVLSSVCEMISTTAAREYGLEYVEINLSIVDCIQTNLAENVLKTLSKYDVKPSEINLEITETSEEGINAVMEENVRKLMAAGVDFSMDDFGTGYSNIARVANMPVKIFKLDKSIIQSAFDSEVNYMVMYNMVKIIKSLGKEIVAEGVETGEQARQIIKLGCNHIQGFFYSRPMPKDQFVEFLKEHNS